jgi:hypothetical protein
MGEMIYNRTERLLPERLCRIVRAELDASDLQRIRLERNARRTRALSVRRFLAVSKSIEVRRSNSFAVAWYLCERVPQNVPSKIPAPWSSRAMRWALHPIPRYRLSIGWGVAQFGPFHGVL